MLRNAFQARFAGDRSAQGPHRPTSTARHRTSASNASRGRTHPAEGVDAEQQPSAVEPMPQADGHP